MPRRALSGGPRRAQSRTRRRGTRTATPTSCRRRPRAHRRPRWRWRRRRRSRRSRITSSAPSPGRCLAARISVQRSDCCRRANRTWGYRVAACHLPPSKLELYLERQGRRVDWSVRRAWSQREPPGPPPDHEWDPPVLRPTFSPCTFFKLMERPRPDPEERPTGHNRPLSTGFRCGRAPGLKDELVVRAIDLHRMRALEWA
jgi:hypothetical protein